MSMKTMMNPSGSASSAPATSISSVPSGFSSSSSSSSLNPSSHHHGSTKGFQPLHHDPNEVVDEFVDEEEDERSSEGSQAPDSSGTPRPKKEGGSGKISIGNLKDQQQEVVAWLKENYDVDEEISLARDAIYGHYAEYCQGKHAEKMGTASFGKMIRLVFPAVKTRRLGIRGQSKYHYQGVRIKGSSPLAVKETQQRSLPQSKR